MGATSLKPIVGVTCDVGPHARSGRATCSVSLAYEECIARAGGVAIVLPPLMECLEDHLALCDAFVFTGGDDPRTEEFGEPTHPKATPMDPRRQAYEVALLRALQAKRPDAPVLGICLGMQLMSLVAGGSLEQHLPDVLPTHSDHYAKDHEVRATAAARALQDMGFVLDGSVASHHRQAVLHAGTLEIVARSRDGVVEAVRDPRRALCLGVQWHPERTVASPTGQEVFDRLVEATRKGQDFWMRRIA